MIVNGPQLQLALLIAPTPTWRAGMNTALHIIRSNSAAIDDTWVVDDAAWSKAMNILARLPSGGRWVWKAREQLFWALERAMKGESDGNR
jgi:hypothetical protein